MDKQTCIDLVSGQNIGEDIKQVLFNFLNTCDNILTEEQLSDFRKIIMESEGKLLDESAEILGIDMTNNADVIQAESEYLKEANEIKKDFEQEKQDVEEMIFTLSNALQDVNKTEDAIKIQDLQNKLSGQ